MCWLGGTPLGARFAVRGLRVSARRRQRALAAVARHATGRPLSACHVSGCYCHIAPLNPLIPRYVARVYVSRSVLSRYKCLLVQCPSETVDKPCLCTEVNKTHTHASVCACVKVSTRLRHMPEFVWESSASVWNLLQGEDKTEGPVRPAGALGCRFSGR